MAHCHLVKMLRNVLSIDRLRAHRLRRSLVLGMVVLCACQRGVLGLSAGDVSVTTLEDTPYRFSLTEFVGAIGGVEITSLPALGLLTVNDAAVAAGSVLSATEADALVYTPAADVTAPQRFAFRVQFANGELDATVHTLTINITNVNDAPAGSDGQVKIVESSAHVFAAEDFGLNDARDVPANALRSVAITTLPAAGTFTLEGALVTAGQVVLASELSRLVFTPEVNTVGLAYARFTFRVQDDGGVANAGEDTAASENTLVLDVVPLNLAPSGSDVSFTINEDVPHVFSVGDFGFSDPNLLPNALAAVNVATLPSQGLLSNGGVPVLQNEFISVRDIESGRFVFTPARNTFGAQYTSFTFRVQDDGGVFGGGVDLASVATSIGFDVLSVNDAPEGQDATVTTLEDDLGYVFAPSDFGFSDAADTPPNAFIGVQIVSLPDDALMTNNGFVVEAGQIVSMSNLVGGLLRVIPHPNFSGATTFRFAVQDDGGTALGASDLDVSPKVMTVAVTEINDAPFGTNATLVAVEDVPYTFNRLSFGFADPFDSIQNSFAAVRFNSVPTLGSLTVAGVPVVAGDSVPVASINAGLLVFKGAQDGAGDAYTHFDFQVQDDGGTDNGGVDLDPSPNTITFDVAPVNDAPLFSNATFTTFSVDEDTPFALTAGNAISIVDPDAGSGVLSLSISAVHGGLSVSGPSGLTGTLQLSGTLASLNASLAALVYQGQPNYNVAFGAETVTFVVNDNGNSGAGIARTATKTLSNVVVNAVNDKPVAVSQSVTAQANLRRSITVDLASASDADRADPGFSLLLTMQAPVASGNCVGSTISNFNASSASFDFDPPPGQTGVCTLTYTVSDNGAGSGGAQTSDPASISVTVQGPVVWFVDSGAPSGGNGLWVGSNARAFQTLAQAQAAIAANTEQRIFVANAGTYASAVTLNANEGVFGQGVVGASFDAVVLGLTPPTGTATRPAINAARPTLTNTITLNSANTIAGLDFVLAAGAALTGVGASSAVVSDVSVSGGGVSVASASGTWTFTNFDVSASTSRSLDIDGGAASFSFDAASSVGDTGQGLRIANKTSGAVLLSGPVSATTGANPAVTLSNNGSATIEFSGGLSLATTTGTAFSATGGGTITVCDENPCSSAITRTLTNQVSASAGPALNVTTTIGANGLTFLSVSSNASATPGINLSNTGSGGLTITGNTANAANGSGGTISNTTGASETTGTPGIRLNNVQNVRLSRMNISGNNHSGIYGTTVDGFQLDYCTITANGNTTTSNPDEAGVDLSGLSGSAAGGTHPTRITNTTISNNWELELQVSNSTGTLTDLQLTNTSLLSNGATGAHSHLLSFVAQSSASMGLTISGGSFTGAAPNTGSGVAVVANGGNVTANIFGASFTGNDVAVSFANALSGALSFDLHDNPVITGSRTHGVSVFSAVNAAGAVNGKIRNNTIGTLGTASSAALLGFGINLQNEATDTATPANFLVSGNTVQESANSSVTVSQGSAGQTTSRTTNVTLTLNTLRNSAARAITVQQNNNTDAAGSAGSSCVNLASNVFSGIAGASGDGTEIRLRQLAGGTFSIVQADPLGLPSVSRLDTINGLLPADLSLVGSLLFGQSACPTPP